MPVTKSGDPTVSYLRVDATPISLECEGSHDVHVTSRRVYVTPPIGAFNDGTYRPQSNLHEVWKGRAAGVS